MAHVEPHNSVELQMEDGWDLLFQYCTYHYNDGESETGYRFIWQKDGKLRPQRGQARIPDAATLQKLLELAKKDGWYK